MFDVSSQELLLIGLVAVVVIPPKDLPRAMRFAGQWIGRARGMARHFRSGIDEMIRQAELEEIEKKWREENERIMREHPLHDAVEHPPEDDGVMAALPVPAAEPALPKPASDSTAPAAETTPFPNEGGASASETMATMPEIAVPVDGPPSAAVSYAEAGPVATDAVPVRATTRDDGLELPLGLPPRQ